MQPAPHFILSATGPAAACVFTLQTCCSFYIQDRQRAEKWRDGDMTRYNVFLGFFLAWPGSKPTEEQKQQIYWENTGTTTLPSWIGDDGKCFILDELSTFNTEVQFSLVFLLQDIRLGVEQWRGV